MNWRDAHLGIETRGAARGRTFLACTGAPLALAALLASGCGRGGNATAGRNTQGLITITGNQWRPMGPTFTPNGQAMSGTTGITGRVSVVAANPQKPIGDVWVGSAGGGVWNGGLIPARSWQPMSDDWASLAIGAIALDVCTTIRCNAVWVGTGENSIRRDTLYGAGVYRGSWNGQRYSWSDALGGDHFSRGAISALVLDPTTPDGPNKRLFVGLSSGMSANETDSSITTRPLHSYGIWRSNNAGISWLNVLPTLQPVSDLKMDPQDARTLYAAIRYGGFVRSTDGGDTWAPMNNGIPALAVQTGDWPILSVSHPPSSPATLYGVVGQCPSPFKQTGRFWCSPAMYKSVNGGASWAEVYAVVSTGAYGDPLSTYTSYNHALAVSPLDPNRIWYGGTNLYLSNSGGQWWLPTGEKFLHPDHHQVLVFASSTSPTGEVIYDVNDGGFYMGYGNDQWFSNYQDGLDITEFQSVSLSPLTDKIIGGTQDNGTILLDGSGTGKLIDGGDGSSTVMSSDNVDVAWNVFVGPKPRRTISGLSGGFQYYLFGLGTERVGYYAPLIEDPNLVGVMHPVYFATQKLYQTPSPTQPWHAISDVLGGHTFYPEIDNENVISAVAIAPSDSNRIYLGSYEGQVFTTANGQSASPDWVEIDQPPLPAQPIISIAVHPTDPTQAFVAVNAFGSASVFRTGDAGASWSPFSANDDAANEFAKQPVNVLRIEPVAEFRMWADTNSTVYSRPTAAGDGSLWTKTNPNLPNVPVYDLTIDAPHQVIYAATHGRGIWALSTQPFGSIYGELCCGYIDLFDPDPFSSIFANQFDPRQSCTMTLFQASGDACGPPTSVDADHAVLTTDSRGALVASKRGVYNDRKLAWACYGAVCAGDIPASRCNPASVTVTCGSRSFTAPISHALTQSDPPSTAFSVRPDFRTGPPRATLTVMPTLKATDGTTAALCTASVDFDRTDTEESILLAAARALNASSMCISNGVSAAVEGIGPRATSEDDFPGQPKLVLRAPSQRGVQLFTSVRASTNGAFKVDSIGVPGRSTHVVPRLTFAGSARGGAIEVTELSPVGSCTISVRTATGDTADVVASRVERAFMASPADEPRSFGSCLTEQNARDVWLARTTLEFALGSTLVVSNTDPGLTYTIDTQ